MKKYLLPCFLILLSHLLLVSCKEEDVESPALMGTLRGLIYDYSARAQGESPLADVTVTIAGSGEERTFVTNVYGEIETTDLPAGTYDITLSKEGFCTHRIVGYAFAGGEAADWFSMWLVPVAPFWINSVTITPGAYEERRWMDITTDVGTTGDARSYVYLRYYLSTDPNVSSIHYMDVANPIYASTGKSEFANTINTAMFPPGTTLYAKFYPCLETQASYPDLDTGLTIYSSVHEDTGFGPVTIVVPGE